MKRLIAFIILRKKLIFLGIVSTGFLGLVPIIILGGHQLIEVVDSAAFCTQTCHNVHYAEAVTYEVSPHSNVSCANCPLALGLRIL